MEELVSTRDLMQQRLLETHQRFEKEKKSRYPLFKKQLVLIEKRISFLESPTCTEPYHLSVQEIQRLQQEHDRISIQLKGLGDPNLLEQFERDVKAGAMEVIEKQEERQFNHNVDVASMYLGKRIKLKRQRSFDSSQQATASDETTTSLLASIYQTKDMDDEDELMLPTNNPVPMTEALVVSISEPEPQKKKANANQLQLIKDLRIPLDVPVVQPKSMVTSQTAKMKQMANENKAFCPACFHPVRFMASDFKIVCTNCSLSEDYVDQSTISQSVINNELEHSKSAFDCVCHLLDVIQPFRPMQEVVIEQSVYDSIKDIIRTKRFEQSRYITFSKTATYLRDLKLHDYIRFRFQITFTLNNQRYPILTQKQEDLIIFVFLQLLKSFESKRLRQAFSGKSDDGGDDEDLKVLNQPHITTIKYEFYLATILDILNLHEFKVHLKLLQVPARAMKSLMLIKSIFDNMGLKTPRLHLK